jgi:hypothetical protein
LKHGKYLQCDLLDKVVLTIVILKVKLPDIKLHEQHLQKYVNEDEKLWHKIKIQKEF